MYVTETNHHICIVRLIPHAVSQYLPDYTAVDWKESHNANITQHAAVLINYNKCRNTYGFKIENFTRQFHT